MAQIKLMYVSGDSFSFGQELGYDGTPATHSNFFNFTDHHRTHCYSGIIADTLGIPDYINTSFPSGSNQRVYRMLLKDIPCLLQVYDPSEIFVQISLTHASRREFHFSSVENWVSYMATYPPKNDNWLYKFWDAYSRETNNDINDYNFDNLIIQGIHNLLIRHKIPYLITDSMGGTGEEALFAENISPEALAQLSGVRYRPFESFHNFTITNQYLVGPSHHPLEEAHRAWATRLLNYIIEYNLLNNEDIG